MLKNLERIEKKHTFAPSKNDGMMESAYTLITNHTLYEHYKLLI